jgi:chlorobactene glucosyltransferase
MNLLAALALLSTAVLLFMTTMALWNLAAAPRAERLPKPAPGARRPRVSLLVPCRNEAVTLPILAEHLAALRYPDLEIALLDDASTDATARELELLVWQARAAGLNARWIEGRPLPAGWFGKSWACRQLADAATGEIFIFCDADARPAPEAVERTVAVFERYGTGAATFMPRQVLGSWAEKAVLPVLLHVSLICFLPIALVPRLSWRKLGVANGQWLAFRRAAYETLGGHGSVRGEIVEDLALAQRVQTLGLGLTVALAPRTLEVRMYRNAREVWEGFGKNLFILTGGSFWKAPAPAALFALIHILPWALFPFAPALWATPLLLLVLNRLLVAAALREPWSAIFWHIPGAHLVPANAARSLRDYRRKRLIWKGRTLAHAAPASSPVSSTSPEFP